ASWSSVFSFFKRFPKAQSLATTVGTLGRLPAACQGDRATSVSDAGHATDISTPNTRWSL
ncbi:MAG: hypothetical protein ACYS7M_06305, partial [Planctomycetota bacterium]